MYKFIKSLIVGLTCLIAYLIFPFVVTFENSPAILKTTYALWGFVDVINMISFVVEVIEYFI